MSVYDILCSYGFFEVMYPKGTLTMNNGEMTRRDILRYGAIGATQLLLPCSMFGADEKDAVAKTSAGMVRGRVENDIFVYRGVPYGMDTAKTRFAAPKPAEPWEGVKECVNWGAADDPALYGACSQASGGY